MKQIEELEQKAKNLLLNKELDIYNHHKNNYTYEKEVVLLRILDGNYYKENCTFKAGGWGTLEVQAYYKHILLKPYLQEQLKKKGKKIDENLLKDIRLNYSTTNYIFDNINNRNEIVPNELSHDILFRNFNINQSIEKFYYLPTNDFMSDEEFQHFVNIGYVGTKETYLKPYSVIIYGAYYSRKDLFYKLLSLLHERDIRLKGKKIEYFTDLLPYFDEYSNGFKNGFDEFENVQIKPFLLMGWDKNDYINKVFEYLTKQIIFQHSWLNNHAGLTTSHNVKNTKIYEIVDAFENGQKQGYFYKAWSIVLSNNNLFAPLFEEYFNSKPNIKEQKDISLKNNISKTLKPTKEEDIQSVKEILKPLSGYWKRDLILNENDFSNLIEYTLHIMENNCLPNETKQFPITGASIEFIRKTIHLVYLHLGKKNKSCFVSLTHLFKQLDKTEVKTTNSKFSAYTGNYNNDLQTMITY